MYRTYVRKLNYLKINFPASVARTMNSRIEIEISNKKKYTSNKKKVQHPQFIIGNLIFVAATAATVTFSTVWLFHVALASIQFPSIYIYIVCISLGLFLCAKIADIFTTYYVYVYMFKYIIENKLLILFYVVLYKRKNEKKNSAIPFTTFSHRCRTRR